MPMWRRIFKVRQGKETLFSFWKRSFFGEKDSDQKLSGQRARRKYVVLAVVLAVVCVFLIAPPAYADWGKNLVNWIIAIFTKVLVYILELLGFILLEMVDFLIQIVQFNNFVHASPVKVGWPLLRDTVNMFFIVVVLVSAFATIIGYPKDFHYRQILPKLLLMAVLINFSKTLIGLMIDFSQVVVLTFVNGFKEAAGGNFINALHMREVMNIDTSTGPIITQDSSGTMHVNASTASGDDGPSVYAMFNMMLAAIFGIWVLSLSLTLIIIMTVFFLARIILLWFLLITSPVMFFAWSLPPKLQKGFSAFTDQWWQRLSTALIGGPVMAFFLWLSLALAQTSGTDDALVGTGSSALYNGSPGQEVTSIQSASNSATDASVGTGLGSIVVTQIGSPKTFANFVIMIAFMLLGVQVAVQFSNTLAPKLGSIAGAVGGAGGMMGLGVAGVMAGARVAERGVAGAAQKGYAGVAAGGRFINEKYGITSGMAKQALQAGIVPTQAGRMKAAQIAGAPQAAAKKKAEEYAKSYAGLPPAMFMQEMSNVANSKLSTKAEKMAAHQNMVKQATSSYYTKDQTDKEKTAIAASKYGGRKYDDLNKDEKLAVDTEAQHKVNTRVAGVLQTAQEYAKANNMTELQDDIKEKREKNPALFSGIKDVDSIGNKTANDAEAMKKVQADGFSNFGFTLQHLKSAGFMDDRGNLTVDPETNDDFRKLMKGRQGQLIAANLDYIQNSEEGRRRARAILGPRATPADETAAQEANVTVNASKDGKNYSVAIPGAAGALNVETFAMGGAATERSQILAGVTGSRAAGGPDRVAELGNQLRAFGGRNVEDIGRRLGTNARADQLLNLLSTVNTAANPADKEDAMATILQKGLMDANGLFGVDNAGAFRTPADHAAYQNVVSKAYGQIHDGTNTEVNMRVIAGSISGVKGPALASHGQALSALTDGAGHNVGYEALRKAVNAASGEQANQFREGLKQMANEATVALREQAAGQTLTPNQQTAIDNSAWLKGSQATTTNDKSTVSRVKNFMRGTDVIIV